MIARGLLTEASTVLSKNVNESVSVYGLQDLENLFPQVYEIIKDLVVDRNGNVSFSKSDNASVGVLTLNPYSIAKREDKFGAIDIEKLADIANKLKKKDNVIDVYFDDRGLVAEVKIA